MPIAIETFLDVIDEEANEVWNNRTLFLKILSLFNSDAKISDVINVLCFDPALNLFFNELMKKMIPISQKAVELEKQIDDDKYSMKRLLLSNYS